MIYSKEMVKNKKLLTLLAVFILIVSIPVTLYLAQQRQEIRGRAATPDLPDLDVTYIERVPRYFRYCVTYTGNLPQLCSGTENQKRWPDAGEEIVFTAHVINKGNTASGNYNFKWFLNNSEVANGTGVSLAPSEEATVSYRMTWIGTNFQNHSDQALTFRLYPTGFTDSNVSNNERIIYPKGLTLAFWIRKDWYDKFNSYQNPYGSYSFEDWIQWQLKEMNENFARARYPLTPNGILERINLDKVVVVPTPLTPSRYDAVNAKNASPDKEKIDGHWELPRLTDPDPQGNPNSQGNINWFNSIINTTDWSLIHEFGHQLGVIDLYRLGLGDAAQAVERFRVTDLNGNRIDVNTLTPIFRYGGLMGGGDTSPYRNQRYFESHAAAGLNANVQYRRGFYGDYLFDTPNANYLKIFDALGNPLSGAQVKLYQKDAFSEVVDDTPEITGTTDSQGIMPLPNRSTPGVTTATGHTLKNNPFGQINVVGTNGTMFLKVIKNNQESYHWLTIHDLNLAYWAGQENSATYTINSNIDLRVFDPTNKALNKPASGSRQSIPGHEPAKAVDGDKTTSGSDWALYSPYNPGDWWQVDLGQIMSLGKISIYPAANNPSSWFDAFYVEVSTTGAFSGEQVRIITENDSLHMRVLTYNFPTTQGRYVRVIGDVTQNWVGLQEFEIYAVTSEPTPIPTPGEYFTVQVSNPAGNESFVFYSTNPQTIQDASRAYYQNLPLFPNGKLLKGKESYNSLWSWHYDYQDIQIVSNSIELCDGFPSDVENNLDYWLNIVGRFCPWSGRITGIGLTPTPTPTPTLTPTSTPTPSVIPTNTPTPQPPNPLMMADVDRNGCVGIVDFDFWLRAFTGNPQPRTYPDINQDGSINLLDFNFWFNAMQKLPRQFLCH